MQVLELTVGTAAAIAVGSTALLSACASSAAPADDPSAGADHAREMFDIAVVERDAQAPPDEFEIGQLRPPGSELVDEQVVGSGQGSMYRTDASRPDVRAYYEALGLSIEDLGEGASGATVEARGGLIQIMILDRGEATEVLVVLPVRLSDTGG